jgi:peptidoglycan/LPS O-acetylase OafA/YrhL
MSHTDGGVRRAPEMPTTEQPTSPRPQRDAFRSEIEGLRALAVLLVAVYHIWFGRISGGVDVFLFLTGFFVTLSLTRSIEHYGTVRPTHFLARLARRLLPTAAVVMVGILTAAYLFLPSSRWPAVLDETIASALYFENWSLAAKSVDYLAHDEPASPLQHFWSLAIQGQFYLVWIAALAVAALIARFGRMRARETVFLLCCMAFAVSLTYSIVATGADQTRAYFDTWARLWEFALGGMLALALPRLRLPGSVRVPLGWFGLAALLCCGALLDVSAMFPGYIALWPLGAAMCIVLAGSTGSRFGLDRLLSWAPMMRLGGWSYALYLWHWPILVCYLEVSGRETASLTGGLAVLGLAIALAAATTALVDQRLAAVSSLRTSRRLSAAVTAAFLVPVLTMTFGAQQILAEHEAARADEVESAKADLGAYPGAGVLADPVLADTLEEHPFMPPLDHVKDLPRHYDDGCDAGMNGERAKVCEYGDPDGEYTVALVGASRIAHWFDAFDGAATAAGWRLVVITKSACQFSTETPLKTDGTLNESCIVWNEDVVEALDELRPDLVVTLATRAFSKGEQIYPGFVDRWRMLDDWGVQVMALRDLPRLDGLLPECLEQHAVEDCSTPVDFSRSEQDRTADYEDVPPNVTFVDLAEHVCPDGVCPAVIGNVLTFRDSSHLTATYSATLAPAVEEAVRAVTGWET